MDRNELTSLPEEIVNLHPNYVNLGTHLEYNHLDTANMTSAVRAWADKYNPGWAKTQILTGIKQQSSISKKEFSIVSNNLMLKIICSIAGKKHIKIDLFNTKGVLVRRVADETKAEGIYSFRIRNDELGSGMYILRGLLGEHLFIRQVVIVR